MLSSLVHRKSWHKDHLPWLLIRSGHACSPWFPPLAAALPLYPVQASWLSLCIALTLSIYLSLSLFVTNSKSHSTDSAEFICPLICFAHKPSLLPSSILPYSEQVFKGTPLSIFKFLQQSHQDMWIWVSDLLVPNSTYCTVAGDML